MDSGKNNEGHRSRLRERFVRSGFSGFAEYEIVELFLTFCLPRRDVKPQAKELIEKFGSVKGIVDADSVDIQKIYGVGKVVPIAIKFIKDFAEIYLHQEVRSESCILNSYDKLKNFWKIRIGSLKHEVFEVAYLDAKLKLLEEGVVRVSEGVVDRAIIYPRKIMQLALSKNAQAIIVAHNHPSGTVMPSDGDKIATKKIESSAEILGIRFVDHIIVSQTEIYSFKKSMVM